ncbi:MAG: hypothetical protein QXW04_01495 [Candidatus Aenigmatarchaeota archaeon]|nr:hypothetical protein [Candidatus Aenigmarchaeota archaeon]
MRIFDNEIIRIINLVENLSNVNVKDVVIFDNVMYIVVEKNQREKLIHLLGILKKILNKDIKILEYSSNVFEFLKELIPFVNFVKIKNYNGIKVAEVGINKVYKGIVYGRNKRKLKLYKTLLERMYKINEIKII